MYLQASVTIEVGDLQQAMRFYTDILGFQLTNVIGKEWVEVQGPGLTITLRAGVDFDRKQGNLSIGIAVDDLDKMMHELHEKGVRFTEEGVGEDRLAHFEDLEGNHLYLVQAL